MVDVGRVLDRVGVSLDGIKDLVAPVVDVLPDTTSPMTNASAS